MFVNTNIVPGSTQVHLAFSPLVVHGQGQRWPAGNSTFVCAKKGSSQRNAFTCVISFDSMQLPLGKVGCYCPHFADEGTEAQRGQASYQDHRLGQGRKVSESKSRALACHQSLCSASPQADLYYQGTVCLHHQEGLLDCSGVGKTVESTLVVYELLSQSLFQAKIVSIPNAPTVWIACLTWTGISQAGRASIYLVLEEISLCLLFCGSC